MAGRDTTRAGSAGELSGMIDSLRGALILSALIYRPRDGLRPGTGLFPATFVWFFPEVTFYGR